MRVPRSVTTVHGVVTHLPYESLSVEVLVPTDRVLFVSGSVELRRVDEKADVVGKTSSSVGRGPSSDVKMQGDLM